MVHVQMYSHLSILTPLSSDQTKHLSQSLFPIHLYNYVDIWFHRQYNTIQQTFILCPDRKQDRITF